MARAARKNAAVNTAPKEEPKPLAVNHHARVVLKKVRTAVEGHRKNLYSQLEAIAEAHDDLMKDEAAYKQLLAEENIKLNPNKPFLALIKAVFNIEKSSQSIYAAALNYAVSNKGKATISKYMETNGGVQAIYKLARDSVKKDDATIEAEKAAKAERLAKAEASFTATPLATVAPAVMPKMEEGYTLSIMRVGADGKGEVVKVLAPDEYKDMLARIMLDQAPKEGKPKKQKGGKYGSIVRALDFLRLTATPTGFGVLFDARGDKIVLYGSSNKVASHTGKVTLPMIEGAQGQYFMLPPKQISEAGSTKKAHLPVIATRHFKGGLAPWAAGEVSFGEVVPSRDFTVAKTRSPNWICGFNVDEKNPDPRAPNDFATWFLDMQQAVPERKQKDLGNIRIAFSPDKFAVQSNSAMSVLNMEKAFPGSTLDDALSFSSKPFAEMLKWTAKEKPNKIATKISAGESPVWQWHFEKGDEIYEFSIVGGWGELKAGWNDHVLT